MSSTLSPISDSSAVLVSTEGAEDRIYLNGGCVGDIQCTIDSDTNARSCVCSQVSNQCSYYLPMSNKWIKCRYSPRSRYRHAVIELNRKIYLIGGLSKNGTVVHEIDVYDVSTDTWQQPPLLNWNSPTYDLVAFGLLAVDYVFLTSDSMYVFGGYREDGSISADVTHVSISTSQITTLNGPAGIRMNFPRAGMTSKAVNKLFYIYGGWNQTGFHNKSQSCPKSLQLVEKFDPSTQLITIDNALPSGTSKPVSGTIGQSTFVIGGSSIDSADKTCTHFSESYYVYRKDIGEAFWSIQGLCPIAFGRNAAVSSSAQSCIYLFGGLSDFDPKCNCYHALDYVYSYTPEYTSTPSFQLSPGGIAAIAVAGFVVLACCGCFIFTLVTRKAVKQLTSFDSIAPI